MHHYRFQNVYISTTASEHIMDTLELFPHNYQMPQLLSTDRLLMAAKYMTDAFTKSSSGSPIGQRWGLHHCGPRGFSSHFQTQIMTSFVPRDSSSACQGRPTPNPLSLINPNLELTHAHWAANTIKDDNSHP
jgi:hypothetical protein